MLSVLLSTITAVFVLLTVTGIAKAQASADEAKQLGTTLTSWGAEKAGNKDGTIPAYTGGVENPPKADYASGVLPARRLISALLGSWSRPAHTYAGCCQMGPPETVSWEYPMADRSWEFEMQEFLEDIRLNRQPAANLRDARAALSVVERIYNA